LSAGKGQGVRARQIGLMATIFETWLRARGIG
jgi:hypothetical protein